MPRGPGQPVRDCLRKARESALQAVEVYNKPLSPFRSGSYIMLMAVAWSALFHAVFFQRGEKPYYRRRNSIRFERVDGDYRWWDLSMCLDRYFGSDNNPIRKNLEFFAKLRNKVEHLSVPDLDPVIFGECQALLFNFDEFIAREFGEKYRLAESLYFSLQFAKSQPATLPSKSAAGWTEISTWVQAFRSTLGADIHQSNEYSFQVYLLPRIGNHRSSADIAVEWVQYDPDSPEEMKQYEKVAALIKTKHVPVYNLGGYKPGQVAKLVAAGIDKRFTVYHHTIAWRHWQVRPEKEAANPAACQGAYCYYDPVHKDYVYTKKWVDMLTENLSDPQNYDGLFKTSAAVVSGGATVAV